MAQLRDLTDGPKALPVEVTWSPVYEVLAALWTLSDKQHSADNELGHEFVDRHLGSMDADRRVDFERVSQGAGLVWLSFFAEAADVDDLTPETKIKIEVIIRRVI